MNCRKSKYLAELDYPRMKMLARSMHLPYCIYTAWNRLPNRRAINPVFAAPTLPSARRLDLFHAGACYADQERRKSALPQVFEFSIIQSPAVVPVAGVSHQEEA
jgi:hypothetical protein